MLFCFSLVFNNIDRPQVARFPESEDHNCTNSHFPFVNTEIVSAECLQVHGA